jgi:hypothetical protein
MTFEITIIIVSLGGLILTATGLILTQFRASRRDLNVQLAGIRSDLRDATREIGKNRDRIVRVEVSLTERIGQVEVSLRERIAQVEVSLTERIAQVEVSLTERIAQVEVSLTRRIAKVEASLGDRIARVEGNVDVLREHFVGKGRKVV